MSTIGPLCFVAMQGEVCAPIGMRIKDAFRRQMPLFLGSYMGEHNLYIPTRELVRLDAYQAQVIRIQYASPVGWAPEVEDEMVDGSLQSCDENDGKESGEGDTVILRSDTNPASLGDDLARQLRGSVPEFAEAVAEFGWSVPLPEREKLDALAQKVLQPLAYLVQKPELRLVLDGFDQLSELTRNAVREALTGSSENLLNVITSRSDTPGCPSGLTLDHGVQFGRQRPADASNTFQNRVLAR